MKRRRRRSTWPPHVAPHRCGISACNALRPTSGSSFRAHKKHGPRLQLVRLLADAGLGSRDPPPTTLATMKLHGLQYLLHRSSIFRNSLAGTHAHPAGETRPSPIHTSPDRGLYDTRRPARHTWISMSIISPPGPRWLLQVTGWACRMEVPITRWN
jgi:hypothetical protein